MGRTYSPFTEWLRTRTVSDGEAVVRNLDLYADYRAWMRGRHPRHPAISILAFTNAIRDRGAIPAGRSRSGMMLRRGLRLIEGATEPEAAGRRQRNVVARVYDRAVASWLKAERGA